MKQILCSFLLLFVTDVVAAGPHGQTTSVGITCIDGKVRALGIYIPPGYKKNISAPLFIWLHGGVNRVEEDRGMEAVKFFADQAQKAGIICAAPSGERGATWFDPVGYANILASFQYVLANFNIDTTKIFFGGSSDGGSACYILAMRGVSPKPHGFIVCSGFPGILQHMGLPFKPAKCKPYQWYIVHTGKDHLYPLHVVQEYVEAMKSAGTSVAFKQYPDLQHGLEYAEKEKPLILKWMKAN